MLEHCSISRKLSWRLPLRRRWHNDLRSSNSGQCGAPPKSAESHQKRTNARSRSMPWAGTNFFGWNCWTGVANDLWNEPATKAARFGKRTLRSRGRQRAPNGRENPAAWCRPSAARRPGVITTQICLVRFVRGTLSDARLRRHSNNRRQVDPAQWP